MAAWLMLDSWAGRESHPVVILKETPKRYKIQHLAPCRMPSKRQRATGDVSYVPKHAVRLDAIDDAEGGGE